VIILDRAKRDGMYYDGVMERIMMERIVNNGTYHNHGQVPECQKTVSIILRYVKVKPTMLHQYTKIPEHRFVFLRSCHNRVVCPKCNFDINLQILHYQFNKMRNVIGRECQIRLQM
jgi:hypothetical protein